MKKEDVELELMNNYPHSDGKVSFGWVCPRCGTVNSPIAYSCNRLCTPLTKKENSEWLIHIWLNAYTRNAFGLRDAINRGLKNDIKKEYINSN